MLVGFARVSTQEQTLALQQDALLIAGCERVFTDTISGAKWTAQERTGLTEALQYMRSGDTLVVWKLDRLGRWLKQLIETVTSLQERGIGFRSLTEQIDPTSSGGKLVFHIFGALAEVARLDMWETANYANCTYHHLCGRRRRPSLQVCFGRGASEAGSLGQPAA